MKSYRALRNVIAAALMSGCATAPSTLPDLTSLHGPWDGSFASATAGHSGTIHVSITHESSAEVLLIASEGLKGGSRYWTESVTVQQPELSSARIERIAAKTVRLTLNPFRDVSCDCNVTVVLNGVVNGDVIEGTYQARSETDQVVFEGNWKARRLLLDT